MTLTNRKAVVIIGGVRQDTSVSVPLECQFEDIKINSNNYYSGIGGSAARAAMIISRLNDTHVTLMCKGAKDGPGREFAREMKTAGVEYKPCMVSQFPLSVFFLKGAERFGVLCDSLDPADDETRWTEYPVIDLSGCNAVYFDGRLPHAALGHAKQAR